MNIGTVSERAGVPAKTIRYYESIGLIRSAGRRANNYRDYDETDVATLRFVARARKLGFSVKQVGALLALWRDRRRPSQAVKAVALEHVAEIDERLAELQSMRRLLLELIEHCHGDARPDCPILDDLAGGAAAERVAADGRAHRARHRPANQAAHGSANRIASAACHDAAAPPAST